MKQKEGKRKFDPEASTGPGNAASDIDPRNMMPPPNQRPAPDQERIHSLVEFIRIKFGFGSDFIKFGRICD